MNGISTNSPGQKKKVDLLWTRRKRQHNIGQCKAMQYFDENKDKKMTWLAFSFDNEKGLTGGGKADTTDNSCHREKIFCEVVWCSSC